MKFTYEPGDGSFEIVDPVFCDRGVWKFWDETGTYCYGNYVTEGEAREALADRQRRTNGD